MIQKKSIPWLLTESASVHLNKYFTQSYKKFIDSKANTINTPSEKAENFNIYFANIASNLKNSSARGGDSSTELHKQFLQYREQNEINLEYVRSKKIYDVIRNFKNKATLDTKISTLKIANT